MAERIYKSKQLKVYKNKKINNAGFIDYSLNEYQVFLHLISKIGGVDNKGQYLQPEELQREHVLTAKEYAEQFNLDVSWAYKVLKSAANRLMNTNITIEKPDLFETWMINVCSIAKYNTDTASVSIKFTEEIMPYLAQVKKKFVLYNIKEIANFGSIYSTRLYELIQEFKDTGWIDKSVEELRNIFATGLKFKKYNDFKNRTFAHAVDEINAQYHMNLKFEEVKVGRKVEKILFTFNKTYTVQNGINPLTGEKVNRYIKPKPKTLEEKEQEHQAKLDADYDAMEKRILAQDMKRYGNERSIDYDVSYAVDQMTKAHEREEAKKGKSLKDLVKQLQEEEALKHQ